MSLTNNEALDGLETLDNVYVKILNLCSTGLEGFIINSVVGSYAVDDRYKVPNKLRDLDKFIEFENSLDNLIQYQRYSLGCNESIFLLETEGEQISQQFKTIDEFNDRYDFALSILLTHTKELPLPGNFGPRNASRVGLVIGTGTVDPYDIDDAPLVLPNSQYDQQARKESKHNDIEVMSRLAADGESRPYLNEQQKQLDALLKDLFETSAGDQTVLALLDKGLSAAKSVANGALNGAKWLSELPKRKREKELERRKQERDDERDQINLKRERAEERKRDREDQEEKEKHQEQKAVTNAQRQIERSLEKLKEINPKPVAIAELEHKKTVEVVEKNRAFSDANSAVRSADEAGISASKVKVAKEKVQDKIDDVKERIREKERNKKDKEKIKD